MQSLSFRTHMNDVAVAIRNWIDICCLWWWLFYSLFIFSLFIYYYFFFLSFFGAFLHVSISMNDDMSCECHSAELHRQIQIQTTGMKKKKEWIDRIFFHLLLMLFQEWKFCRLLNPKFYKKFLIIDFLCSVVFAMRFKYRLFLLSENGASTSYPIRK